MKTPTLDDLRRLLSPRDETCLTIVMSVLNDDADQARWEGLRSRAREALSALPKRESDALLDQLTLRLPKPPARGLTVFRSKSVHEQYQSDVPVKEGVWVSRRFQVRGLLESIRSNARFFLLDLTHNRVALFEGDHFGLAPRAVPDLPASFDVAVGVEHADRVVSLTSAGHTNTVWHGQGKLEATRHEDELKFVRAVADAIKVNLADESAPLLVSGAGKLPVMFKEHCSYAHLLPEIVHGSFANAQLGALHARSWPVVQSRLDARDKQLVDDYHNSVSGDKATDEVTTLGRAAVEGRIQTLLLAKDGHLFGKLDAKTGAVEVSNSAEQGDILDRLLEEVVTHGGNVHTLDAGQMPSRSSAAATLRW